LPTDRTKRVREARDEAKKEIDAYRAQKEQEYKKFEAEVDNPIPDISIMAFSALTGAPHSIPKATSRPKRKQAGKPRHESAR